MKLWQHATARAHLIVAGAVGIIAGVVVALIVAVPVGALTAWITAAAIFLVLTWPPIWRLDESGTARFAQREDPGQAPRDIILLVGSAASILAVALVIIPAGRSDWPLIIMGVACIVVSWALVHTIFTLKYARLYYAAPQGGLDFNQEGRPTFRDFAYVSFTVGMTFQVSDTDIETSDMRSTVLRQALLSFLYAAIIIAVTINVIAGISNK